MNTDRLSKISEKLRKTNTGFYETDKNAANLYLAAAKKERSTFRSVEKADQRKYPDICHYFSNGAYLDIVLIFNGRKICWIAKHIKPFPPNDCDSPSRGWDGAGYCDWKY